jgi:hypothetical protein
MSSGIAIKEAIKNAQNKPVRTMAELTKLIETPVDVNMAAVNGHVLYRTTLTFDTKEFRGKIILATAASDNTEELRGLLGITKTIVSIASNVDTTKMGYDVGDEIYISKHSEEHHAVPLDRFAHKSVIAFDDIINNMLPGIEKTLYAKYPTFHVEYYSMIMAHSIIGKFTKPAIKTVKTK